MSKLILTTEARDLFVFFYSNFPPAHNELDARRFISTKTVCEWL